MFKRLLIPTDGSPLSYKAVQAALDFAGDAGASVTAYYALPRRELEAGDDAFEYATQERYDSRMRHQASIYLSVVENEARERKIPCELVMNVAGTPSAGILDAAKDRQCDLIFMASNGRKQCL
jgi:nucleotide-binding universal stress UspA family protein